MSIGTNGSARGQNSGSAIPLPVVGDGKGTRNHCVPCALDPLPLGQPADKTSSWSSPTWRAARSGGSCRAFVPLGTLTALDGQKGEGKSAIVNDWAARVTAGKLMPFCDGEPIGGGAILLDAEDDLGATVKASIEAAERPREVRVYTKAEPLYLDDPEDLAVVRQAAKEIDARLLVADPFSEFFSRTLKDEKTIRNSLRLLRALAADLLLAVILVRHFTKIGTHALYRGLGGVAVINAARGAGGRP